MSDTKLYRKLPVEIEARQWVSDLPEQLAYDLTEWCGGRYDPCAAGPGGPNGEDWGCLEIETLEGVMEVSPYDFVIKGVNGEFYPCKPDIFAKTYEAVDSRPVTYPGGTQWAIKHTRVNRTFYDDGCGSDEDRARQLFTQALNSAKGFWPDNPEKWPQLVSAHITWQVVE